MEKVGGFEEGMAVARGLLAAVGMTGWSVGAQRRSQSPGAGRSQQAAGGLRSKFEVFLTNYVPAGPAANLWSMFARYTSAGRIDLSRTKSLSDLLHQMQQNLAKHQATQDKRYYSLMKAFRDGVKAWEKQQTAEERKRILIADELRLSEQAREKRQANLAS